MPHPLAVI